MYVTEFGKMCIVHTSSFSHLKIQKSSIGTVHRSEICGNDRGMVALSCMFQNLSINPNRFYESSKLKNWMCELCMFSQIWSHIYLNCWTWILLWSQLTDVDVRILTGLY